MPATQRTAREKLVLDRDRHPVGTVPAEALDGPPPRKLAVELTPGARRELDTDAERIEIPRTEIAAIRRDGLRLTTTLRGLRIARRGPR